MGFKNNCQNFKELAQKYRILLGVVKIYCLFYMQVVFYENSATCI